MWGWRGRHGDDRDDVGTMGQWGQHGWGQRGQRGWRGRRGPHGDLLGAMGMMWGQRGWCGDDMGMTRMTRGWRGPRGDHGDNKITKNAITFERIEIIEFRLKIWDPWALPHTYTLQLMYSWLGVLSQMTVLSKNCSCDPWKFFLLFLHWIPLDHT